jgi:ribonuclease-3
MNQMNQNHENLSELEKRLKVTFKNKKLLERAMIHRSFLNETREKNLCSNERLEFLGDAVLEFWVSDQIFQRFPDFPEGQMTFIRTHLVRTETLTTLAQKLKLGEALLMSKGEEQGGGRNNPVLLANAFEAVVGAIFLDSGIQTVSRFLSSQFEGLLSSITTIETLKDSKSRLQETVQSQGHPSPVYRLVSSSGPDHQKIFTMGVYLDDRLLAEGIDKSKQEAEEKAAEKALEILDKIK